jgi:hypothetical protein
VRTAHVKAVRAPNLAVQAPPNACAAIATALPQAAEAVGAQHCLALSRARRRRRRIPPPARSYGAVYGILLFIGIGTLMPWNVFITEKEFWDIRLHQDPFNPFVAHNFMNLFAMTFNIL